MVHNRCTLISSVRCWKMRNDTKQLVCLPACPSVAVVVFLYRLRETCVHLIFISQLVLIHNKIICMVL